MVYGEKVNFSEEQKMWKAHFLELQVRQAISPTVYELETSDLTYSTRYNQPLTILH